ncbi:MAG: 6,7-dimethyl-8-ribityllumazine synthase [Nitratireductor sp.]|nr:6,7-dimethyl-8-ribityllumazine synthase [Nitratireductor sp.]
MSQAPHLLIVEARFYEDLADELLAGAVKALERAGATFDRVTVPGALEIPGAISMALTGAEEGGAEYDGFVALGCVIRGETGHYDVVAGESARGLMDLSIEESVAIGNGILTCDNAEQAWARARVSEKNKGGGAAEAALAMIALRDRFGA